MLMLFEVNGVDNLFAKLLWLCRLYLGVGEMDFYRAAIYLGLVIFVHILYLLVEITEAMMMKCRCLQKHVYRLVRILARQSGW